MADVDFSTRLITNLRAKLADSYEVVPGYSKDGTLSEVYDLAILEDGHLKMLFELEVGDSFEEAKQGLRKFYSEMKEISDLVLAACSHEKLVVFDAEHELLSEKYSEQKAENMADDIADILTGEE